MPDWVRTGSRRIRGKYTETWKKSLSLQNIRLFQFIKWNRCISNTPSPSCNFKVNMCFVFHCNILSVVKQGLPITIANFPYNHVIIWTLRGWVKRRISFYYTLCRQLYKNKISIWNLMNTELDSENGMGTIKAMNFLIQSRTKFRK